MLIKKDPVTTINIKENGEIEIIHHTDGKKKPCIYCGTLTKERRLGLAVCPSCIEYGYSKCKECKYGVKQQTFHCNGNDDEDYISNYIGCAKRDFMGELRETPDFKYCPSAWHVSPLERRKCFEPKKEREHE